MKFKLTIDCDNDAFATDLNGELADVLRGLARTIDRKGLSVDEVTVVRDANGNTVGKAMLGESSVERIPEPTRRAATVPGAGRRLNGGQLDNVLAKLHTRAKKRGHSLMPWERGVAYFYAECRKCGDAVNVRVADGAADGNALTEDCNA